MTQPGGVEAGGGGWEVSGGGRGRKGRDNTRLVQGKVALLQNSAPTADAMIVVQEPIVQGPS